MAARNTNHAECRNVKHAAVDTIHVCAPEILQKSGAHASLATQPAPCSVHMVGAQHTALRMLRKRTSSARLALLLSSGVSAKDTKPVSPPTRRQRSADSVTY